MHDVLAVLAIEVLKKRFPEIKFNYTNAGAAGIDIEGRRNSKKFLIAEVKTTTGNLRNPQGEAIKKDLVRLKESIVKHKFLILMDAKIKRAVEKKFGKQYLEIKILNVLEE